MIVDRDSGKVRRAVATSAGERPAGRAAETIAKGDLCVFDTQTGNLRKSTNK